MCLLYPQPSVMGWAGRDKLSNQKIEGSISGCDNLIRQLICINICTAWWCRWAFAYFLFLDFFWQAGGECRAFLGCQGELGWNIFLCSLSSALFLWCQKRVGAKSNHPFSALSCQQHCHALPVFSGKHGRVKRQRVRTSVLSELYDWLWQDAPFSCKIGEFLQKACRSLPLQCDFALQV